MSRSDLSEKINVGRSALTEISHDLIQMGLLHEVSVVRNNLHKGRPSILLSMNLKYGYFVGVDIANTPQLMVLTDLLGTIVGEYEISGNGEPQTVVDSIQSGIRHLIEPEVGPKRKVLGIGIALSGFTDYVRGVCIYSAALNWHNVPIADLVTRATGIPTYIDNNANAVAIAEKLFGEARDLKNFSLILLSTKIGCAHYIHGQLYRGNDGGAGEIGHITVVPDGQQCRCGKRGCLETIAASGAILSEAAAAQLSGKNVQDIETLAAKGNPDAIAILRKAGEALGLVVANVIQVNNPELVLFADIAGFSKGLFTVTTRQTIENNILSRFLSSTRLVFHHVKPSFLARGAASIATHEFMLEQVAR
jgi:predicted NBD/HSP70 family sugar kinase